MLHYHQPEYGLYQEPVVKYFLLMMLSSRSAVDVDPPSPIPFLFGLNPGLMPRPLTAAVRKSLHANYQEFRIGQTDTCKHNHYD